MERPAVLFGRVSSGGECGARPKSRQHAGEAKFIRKHDGIEPSNAAKWITLRSDLENYRKELKKELGDVLWMVAAIATLNKFDMAEIMQENIDKLTDRLNRGVIVSEGDNR